MSKPDDLGHALLNLRNFTTFQKELHLIQDEGGQVPIRFMSSINKTPWSSIVKVQMDRNVQNDSEHSGISDFNKQAGKQVVTYRTSMKFDQLIYTYLTTATPRIKIKDQLKDLVRICWTSNIFHHIIVSGDTMINGNSAVGFGDAPRWLDKQKQHFMKAGAGFADLYDEMVGNHKFLTTWTDANHTTLPSYPIMSPQPWFYAENYKKSIPLHLMGENQSFEHVYRFDLNIKNFIRIQARKAIRDEEGNITGYDEWFDSPFSLDIFDRESEMSIPTPHMWACYSKMTEKEKQFHRSWEQPHNIIATNIIPFRPENPTPSGTKIVVPIETDTPVSCFYYVAENLNARKFNNLSNYTTNSKDRYSGWEPVKSVVTSYGQQAVQKLNWLQTNCAEIWYHNQSAPRDKGYGIVTASYSPGGGGPDIGTVCTKKLNLSLEFEVSSNSPIEDGVDHLAMDDPDNSDDIINSLLRLDRNVQRNPRGDVNDKYQVVVHARSFKIIRFRHGEKVVIDDGRDSTLIETDKNFP